MNDAPPVVAPEPQSVEAVPIWVPRRTPEEWAELFIRAFESGVPWPMLELDDEGRTWILDVGPEKEEK